MLGTNSVLARASRERQDAEAKRNEAFEALRAVVEERVFPLLRDVEIKRPSDSGPNARKRVVGAPPDPTDDTLPAAWISLRCDGVSEELSLTLGVGDEREILAVTGDLDDSTTWALKSGASAAALTTAKELAEYLLQETPKDEEPKEITLGSALRRVAVEAHRGASELGEPFQPTRVVTGNIRTGTDPLSVLVREAAQRAGIRIDGVPETDPDGAPMSPATAELHRKLAANAVAAHNAAIRKKLRRLADAANELEHATNDIPMTWIGLGAGNVDPGGSLTLRSTATEPTTWVGHLQLDGKPTVDDGGDVIGHLVVTRIQVGQRILFPRPAGGADVSGVTPPAITELEPKVMPISMFLARTEYGRQHRWGSEFWGAPVSIAKDDEVLVVVENIGPKAAMVSGAFRVVAGPDTTPSATLHNELLRKMVESLAEGAKTRTIYANKETGDAVIDIDPAS